MDCYQTDQHICPKCQMSFEASYTYCPHCGKRVTTKKWFAFIAVIFMLLIFGLAFLGFVLFKKAQAEAVCEKAFDAMYAQKFSEAKSFLDQVPNSEERFSAEYEYIEAGILMEQGDYLKSLLAFRSQSLPVSKELIKELEYGTYFEAIQFYRDENYSKAKEAFTELHGYRLSDEYLLLMRCKRGNQGHYYDDLVELIDIEDAKEIILSKSIYAEQFFLGTWRTLDKAYYFKMNASGQIDTNFPKTGQGRDYILKNGVCSLRSNGTYTVCYKFRITRKDTCVLFCYKNGETYYLYRE